MPQRFLLDRRLAGLYLGVLAAACGGSPGSVVPADAPTLTPAQVAEWTAAHRPEGNRIHRFRWLYRDDRSSIGGRGSTRVAAPDSLRLDVTVALGAGSGAGVVVGDSVLWGRPEDLLARFVPNFDLMWAMFGAVRTPPDGARITGLERAGARVWQYAAGADTTTFVLADDGTSLDASARRAGDLVGTVETRLAEGRPVSARLTVPSGPARLDITFDSTEAVPSFPADLWEPDRR